MLRKVEALETIASGEEVVKYDRELNIKDRTLLIETAEKLCTGKVNTVIFTGMDRHVTFVHAPDLSSILELEILDVAPPYPSWLSLVVKRLDASGIFGDLQVRFTEKVIDLRRFEGKKYGFSMQLVWPRRQVPGFGCAHRKWTFTCRMRDFEESF